MELDIIMAIVGIVGFAASEIIAANPRWKSNSVLQVLAVVLRSLKVKGR